MHTADCHPMFQLSSMVEDTESLILQMGETSRMDSNRTRLYGPVYVSTYVQGAAVRFRALQGLALTSEEAWKARSRHQRPFALQLTQLVMASYEDLVHNPAAWRTLNMRLKEKGAKDVLFGVEDVIKARGPANVREILVKTKDRVTADLVWSLHQPLLSLMVFILRGTNDVHKKLVKVPDLKTDICNALELGEPTIVRKTPLAKPDVVHVVKKLKRLSRVTIGECSSHHEAIPTSAFAASAIVKFI
jgi:hypothetical protein